MMYNLARRIDKIEKNVSKDKQVWLRLPDPDNPGETIEIEGAKTFADFVVLADKARKERRYDQEHRKPA
jgi:hypothetical protein